MIPSGYQSPAGKRQESNMDMTAVLAEIRSVKTEVVADIKDMRADLGGKIDAMRNDHTELQLKFAAADARQSEKTETIEKNVTKLWNEFDKMRERVNANEQAIENHKTAEDAGEKKGAKTAEWVRWIPGGVVAIGAAIAWLASIFEAGK